MAKYYVHVREQRHPLWVMADSMAIDLDASGAVRGYSFADGEHVEPALYVAAGSFVAAERCERAAPGDEQPKPTTEANA